MLTSPPLREEGGARGLDRQTALGDYCCMGQDLAKGQSCRYSDLPKVKAISLAAYAFPLGSQEPRPDQEKGYLDLRGSRGREKGRLV